MNHSKHGNFCGIHVSKDELNTCQGTTLKNKKCTLIVKYGDFCNKHIHTEKIDNKQIVLYEPDVDWPEMRKIQYHIKKFNNGKLLDRYMTNVKSNGIYHDFNTTDTEYNNTILMVCIELIFRHEFIIDFNTEYWQSQVNYLQEKISSFGFLKKYREHFRKMFDNTYRIEHQKNFAEKVLTQSDLGNNLARKILSYI